MVMIAVFVIAQGLNDTTIGNPASGTGADHMLQFGLQAGQ